MVRDTFSKNFEHLVFIFYTNTDHSHHLRIRQQQLAFSSELSLTMKREGQVNQHPPFTNQINTELLTWLTTV